MPDEIFICIGKRIYRSVLPSLKVFSKWMVLDKEDIPSLFTKTYSVNELSVGFGQKFPVYLSCGGKILKLKLKNYLLKKSVELIAKENCLSLYFKKRCKL